MGVNPRNLKYSPRMPAYVSLPIVLGALGIAIVADQKFLSMEAHRMTRFRDKSAMYGKQLGPDDNPSWGPKGDYPDKYRLHK